MIGIREHGPAPVVATGNGAETAQTKRTTKDSKVPTKINRVFAALASGRSFNRFEAERELSDHCLHSTVAAIQRQYGVNVFRERETVPGYMGLATRVCRYRLIGSELDKARAIRRRARAAA